MLKLMQKKLFSILLKIFLYLDLWFDFIFQDFCICIEMFFAALAHFFAFSHKPFIDHTVDDQNCCRSFLSMWDVSDVKDDVIEHVKVVGKCL